MVPHNVLVFGLFLVLFLFFFKNSQSILGSKGNSQENAEQESFKNKHTAVGTHALFFLTDPAH